MLVATTPSMSGGPIYKESQYLVHKENHEKTYNVIVLEAGAGCRNLSAVPRGHPARCILKWKKPNQPEPRRLKRALAPD